MSSRINYEQVKEYRESGSSMMATGTVDKTKIRLYGQVAVVCLLIIGVWTLASVPIILFHLPESETSSNTIGSTGSNSVCSAVQYTMTSGICLTELAKAQISTNCLPDLEGSVAVMRNEESTAIELINGFVLFGASAECLRKAVPFLCLYLFGLCGRSGVSIQPTSSQCEEIRDTTCRQQWMIIERLNIGLPHCEIFPAESFSCPTLNDSLSTNGTVTTNMPEEHSNGTTVEDLECTGDFYQENGLSYCTRSCNTWVEFGKESRLSAEVLGALFVSISCLASAAIIIISCLSKKRMLVFPAIFIVYMFIDYLILDLFIIVGFMDRGKFYCTSRSLTKSLREVTTFCVIFGIVFTYVICQMVLWWIFHTATLFWKVMFTFHALTFENSGKNKYIHMTCVIVGILLPLVPIITIMADTAVDLQEEENENSTFQLRKSLFISEGLGFGPNGFPPIFCSSINSEANFYSLILIVDITLGCGCTMLIFVFWSIHKFYIKRKRSQRNIKSRTNDKVRPQYTFGTAEKKLLTVFCYYVVLIAMVLSVITWDTKVGLMFKDTIQKSLICELGSNDSSKCTFTDPDSIGYDLLQILSFLLLNLLPFVFLLYVVNIQELKDCGKSIKSMIPKNTEIII